MGPYQLWKLDEHLNATKEEFKALADMIHHSRESLKSERRKSERKAHKKMLSIRFLGSEPPTREKNREFDRLIIAYTPHMNKYCGYLPRLINYSCLVLLYALFEDRGTALCNELRRRDPKIPIKLGELGKPNFDTIKMYLTKLCGVEFKHWNQIQLLAKLRHQIAHTSGYTENKELLALVEKTKGLEVFRPYNPPSKGTKSPDLDFDHDPDYVPPDTEKRKPLIIVKNAYIDGIVPVVSGLFGKVFVDKQFGDPSPFMRTIANTPLTVTGSGKKIKVRVSYHD